MPRVLLVALFETAFFDQLDEATVTYAVPHQWKELDGVRRYGFHGASHRAASERALELCGGGDSRPRSLAIWAAVRAWPQCAGVVVMDDKSAISPQSGLPQNNRVGDLDVFAALYLMEKHGITAAKMAHALATQAGLAGIAGGTGDVRDLSEAAARGESRGRNWRSMSSCDRCATISGHF